MSQTITSKEELEELFFQLARKGDFFQVESLFGSEAVTVAKKVQQQQQHHPHEPSDVLITTDDTFSTKQTSNKSKFQPGTYGNYEDDEDDFESEVKNDGAIRQQTSKRLRTNTAHERQNNNSKQSVRPKPSIVNSWVQPKPLKKTEIASNITEKHLGGKSAAAQSAYFNKSRGKALVGSERARRGTEEDEGEQFTEQVWNTTEVEQVRETTTNQTGPVMAAIVRTTPKLEERVYLSGKANQPQIPTFERQPPQFENEETEEVMPKHAHESEQPILATTQEQDGTGSNQAPSIFINTSTNEAWNAKTENEKSDASPNHSTNDSVVVASLKHQILPGSPKYTFSKPRDRNPPEQFSNLPSCYFLHDILFASNH
jgi:hypothetical protein